MLVARSLADVPRQPLSVVTVGTFDGVHIGHQSIIGEVTSRAKNICGRSIVITFDPHPREVISQAPVQLLASPDERLEGLERLGVDVVLVLEFTYEFSRQTSREFYCKYVIEGTGVREVIVGYDHMFGRDREAGVGELQQMGIEFGFRAIAVGPVSVNGEIVSSSKIRTALQSADIERAERFLGKLYAVRGTVVRGVGRGASLGFPTANILPAFPRKLIPGDGVYLVEVDLRGRHHYGMLNIGVNPTFNGAGHQKTIEVHLFDFHEMIYDASVEIRFVKHLRAEKKFPSKEALIEQLHLDRGECLRHIAALPSSHAIHS